MRIQVNLDAQIARKMLAENRQIQLKEVAEQTGLSENRLIAYRKQRGRAIKFDTLISLCRYFDCTPGDLLTLAD